MKKGLLYTLICLLLLFNFQVLCAQDGLSPIAQRVAAARGKEQKEKIVPLFSVANASKDLTRVAGVTEVLKGGLILEWDEKLIQQAKNNGAENGNPSQYLQIQLPVSETEELTLELFKADIITPDFSVINSAEPDRLMTNVDGVHYWGIVKGKPDNLVAISIFENEVVGILNLDNERLVLGAIVGDSQKRHILYNDSYLRKIPTFNCSTDTETPHGDTKPNEGSAENSSNKCVRMYFEADYDLYVAKGSSVVATTNYLTGVFSQVSLLYANEAINVVFNQLKVWTTNDPYSGPSGDNYLNQFYNALSGSFNGDLAHLVGTEGSGGMAWTGQLCNSFKYAFSGIKTEYSNVPIFSWTVYVITHEIGHNLGSGHTHECLWNGNNTAIDGCGEVVGCSTPPIPSGGGTVMSYCHLLPGVGIDFNLGFGPQPGNRIRDHVNSAACLTSCGSCDLIEYVSVNNQQFQATNTATVCEGSYIVLSMGSGTFASGWNFQFQRPDGQWYPGGTNGVLNAQIAFNASGVNVGAWKVRYINSSGCLRTETFVINVNFVPDLQQYSSINDLPFVQGNSVQVCHGSSLLLDNCCSESGFTFTFKRPDGTDFPGGTNGAAYDQILIPNIQDGSLNEGIWTVTYKNNATGCSRTEQINVVVNPLPDFNQHILVNGLWQLTNTASVCSGGYVALGMSGNFFPGWQFWFQRPDGAWFPGGTNIAPYYQIAFYASPGHYGTWKVKYISPNGCERIENFTITEKLENPIGNVDGICSIVKGWAFDPSNPAVSVDVHIYVRDAASGNLLQNHVVSANQHRPDVNSVYGITGNHGFTLNLRPQYCGQNVRVEAYAINIGCGNVNTLLNGSGGTCHIPAAIDLVQFISVNGQPFQQTNTVTVGVGTELLLDMCCELAGWQFWFQRPDGMWFNGSTNGVAPDQIRFNASPGHYGTWNVKYRDPNGCERIEAFVINPIPGLKPSDSDGLSTQAGMSLLSELEEIKFFPNPTRDFITVECGENCDVTEDAMITILNMNGTALREEVLPHGSEAHTLDLSALPPAVYLVRVRLSNGHSKTVRVMKID